jgi:hypothetical protein
MQKSANATLAQRTMQIHSKDMDDHDGGFGNSFDLTRERN